MRLIFSTERRPRFAIVNTNTEVFIVNGRDYMNLVNDTGKKYPIKDIIMYGREVFPTSITGMRLEVMSATTYTIAIYCSQRKNDVYIEYTREKFDTLMVMTANEIKMDESIIYENFDYRNMDTIRNYIVIKTNDNRFIAYDTRTIVIKITESDNEK